jgi:hypothetical protein
MPGGNRLSISFDFIVLHFLGKNEGRGSKMEWVKVVEVHDFGEAEVIRSLLESEGIPVMIKDEEAARIFPGILGNIRILVPEDRVEAAEAELRSVGRLDKGIEENSIDK